MKVNKTKPVKLFMQPFIWYSDKLTPYEKCLLGVIDAFREFYGDNGYLAEIMSTSNGNIRFQLTNLKKKGWLDVSHVGGKRVLKVLVTTNIIQNEQSESPLTQMLVATNTPLVATNTPLVVTNTEQSENHSSNNGNGKINNATLSTTCESSPLAATNSEEGEIPTIQNEGDSEAYKLIRIKGESAPVGAALSIKKSPSGKRGKKSEDLDPRYHPVMHGFIELFKMHHGFDYTVQWGRDGDAVKKLLKSTPDSSDEILGVAVKMWQYPNEYHRDQAMAIHTLCINYSTLKCKANGTNGHDLLKSGKNKMKNFMADLAKNPPKSQAEQEEESLNRLKKISKQGTNHETNHERNSAAPSE